MRIDLVRKIEWPVLAAGYLLAVTGMLFLMSYIAGPFIFADELRYHQLSQTIYENFKFSGRQYNPLYPLLLAPTFGFSEPDLHYWAIKFLNAFSWCSIIFPSYLLARKIIASRKVALLVSMLTVVAPIGAYSQVIWAEPLYYPLIGWSLYFIYCWLDRNKLLYAILAGVAIGLSFLTKQVGILLVIALYTALFFQVVSKRGRPKNLTYFWIIGIIPIGMALLWTVRNKMAEGTLVGYSSSVDLLIASAKSPSQFLSTLMHSLRYPIGYYFASYFGFGFILLLLATHQNRKSSETEQKIVFLARVMVIFSVLSAIITDVFLIGYGRNHFSVGRYIDSIYPAAIVIIAWQAMRSSIVTNKRILFLIAGISIVTFYASPLEQLSADSMVNASGISYLNRLFSKGVFLWSQVPADRLRRGYLSAGLFLISLVVFIKNWKPKIALICLFCVIIGGAGHFYMIRVGESQNFANVFMKEVARKGIDPRSIVFDDALRGGNMPFFSYNFWLARHSGELESKFAEPSVIIETYRISFGVKDGKAAEKDTMKVWAPWNPQSIYRAQIGIGFSDISSIDAARCELSKEAAPSSNKILPVTEFVYSKNKADYLMHLAPGHYRATGFSGDARCIRVGETGYSVFINGSTQKDFVVHNEQEWNVDFAVTEKDSVARITLAPLEGFIWSLANIKVRSLDSAQNNLRGHAKYLVSYQLLPREIIAESNNLYLYNLSSF